MSPWSYSSFENFLDLCFMILISRTDKFIIADIKHIGNILNLSRNLINVLFRCYTLIFSDFLYLLTVFVSTCKEKYILTYKSVKTCYCVRKNYLICITYMRFLWSCNAIGSSNIKLFFTSFQSLPIKLITKSLNNRHCSFINLPILFKSLIGASNTPAL